MNTETQTRTGGELLEGVGGSMDAKGHSDTEGWKEQHSEGKLARLIEDKTSRLPSDTFLWAAVASIGASAVAELMGNKDKSRFFGQWVAPFLLLGVYNKMVKLHGSDQVH